MSDAWYNEVIVMNKAIMLLPTAQSLLITERDVLSMTALDSTTTSYFLYIIRAENGPVKIGITQDPKDRVMHLQTANYVPLSIAYVLDCGTMSKAAKMEDLLHNRYKDRHIRGEWIDISAEEIAQDIQFAIAFSGIDIPPQNNNVTPVPSTRHFHKQSDAREIIREHLRLNPEDMSMKVRDLADKIGRSKTTVGEVMKEMREQNV